MNILSYFLRIFPPKESDYITDNMPATKLLAVGARGKTIDENLMKLNNIEFHFIFKCLENMLCLESFKFLPFLEMYCF